MIRSSAMTTQAVKSVFRLSGGPIAERPTRILVNAFGGWIQRSKGKNEENGKSRLQLL
jgi:hypothetical protein